MGYFLGVFEWGTVSNVLLKSNTAMSFWVPVSKEEKKSCMAVRSCISHEMPALKPWLRSVRMLCSSRQIHKVAVDDVFKDFTWNRCKGCL